MGQQKIVFKKASVVGRKLRCGFQGPSGSGKTATALQTAKGIVEREGGRICLIDAEEGRSELEAHRFDFDVVILQDRTPEGFVLALRAAEQAGYTVVILDGASEEWKSLLRAKDAMPEKQKYTGWAKLTPRHDAFFEALRTSKVHVILTFRMRMAHEIKAVKGEATEVLKLGLAPIARDETEYEIDLLFELDLARKCWLAKPPRGIFTAFEDYNQVMPTPELGHQIADVLGARKVDAPKPAPVPTSTPSSEPTRSAPAPTRANGARADDEKTELRALLFELAEQFMVHDGININELDLSPSAMKTMLEKAISDRIGFWPATLPAARSAVKLATEARDKMLAEDDEPFDDVQDDEPFEEAAESMEPNSPGRPQPEIPPPSPPLRVVPKASEAEQSGPDANQAPAATQREPANGNPDATTPPAESGAEQAPPISDKDIYEAYAIARREGVKQSLFEISRELFKGREPKHLNNAERWELVSNIHGRAVLAKARGEQKGRAR